MNILHLTNKNNHSNFIELMVKENGCSYQKYTCDITKNLDIITNNIVIIKDRYSYELDTHFWLKAKKIISLIPAYLPYNKGTDSNLWSIIENTQKGGSIFFLYNSDYEIEIIKRFEIEYDDNDTLKTSFNKIFTKLYQELYLVFPSILNKKVKTFKINKDDGTIHLREESKDFLDWLPNSYDTKVSEIEALWKKFNKKL